MADSETEHTTHILDFFYDKNHCSALTALVNDVRFHIIVDANDLKQSKNEDLHNTYHSKLRDLKTAEQAEQDADEARKAEQKMKSSKNKKRSKDAKDTDSAVDVSPDTPSSASSSAPTTIDSASASTDLHNYILSFFGTVTSECAPPNRDPQTSTLAEWYGGPTYFYSLLPSSDASTLEPNLLDEDADLKSRITNLVPRLSMPKYIRDYKLPWMSARELNVLNEVASPAPAHPGEVQHVKTEEKYFFKPVVAAQPDSVKREIKLLRKINGMKLDIKVPTLLGFVRAPNQDDDADENDDEEDDEAYSECAAEAMGFLMSPIPKSRPMTELLSAEVPEEKRLAWAEKCEKYVKTLHDNGIIWGDAKGDNFLVDGDDELWIIDFGGSYTDGWVEPELMETKEGDEMGLEKVVKALEDPVNNTVDEEGQEEGAKKSVKTDISATEKRSPLFTVETKKTEKRKRESREKDMEEDEQTKKKKSAEKMDADLFEGQADVEMADDNEQEEQEDTKSEEQSKDETGKMSTKQSNKKSKTNNNKKSEEESEKAKYAKARSGHEPKAFKEPPRTWCLQEAGV